MLETVVGVIADVFRALDGAGVRWCWYKGYQNWPTAAGGDVDLAVPPVDLDKAVAAVSTLARRREARAFVPCSHADVTACYVMFDGLPAIEIDFFSTRWHWAGHSLFDAEDVVARRRRYGDVWGPAPEHEFVLLLLLYGMGSKVTMSRRVSAIERARELARREPSACRLALIGVLGWMGIEIWRLLECGEVERLIHAIPCFRLEAFGRALVGRGAIGVIARAVWVYAGRPLAARCGLWRGFGRSMQPIRAWRWGNAGWDQDWLSRVVRRHQGAWLARGD
jgi:hypothetical protein